uniref:uncharacterized protein LOC120339925 n=1 Tax=Styela clava TaxID=7725 RepID=UPI00193A008A|nr:uncharacterized protein LOC120339925 [Styela clava]
MSKEESLVRWLKLILCFLVITLWISCLGLLCVSCWIRDNLSKITLVTEGTSAGNFYLVGFFPVVFPVLISVSCLLLVIGCLGCCGAFTENKVILAWFFFSVLASICVEISAGVWGMLDWKITSNEKDLSILLENAKKYGNKEHAWFIKAWEEIHEKFQCCGIRSYRDWEIDHEMLKTCCEGSENCIYHSSRYAVCGNMLLDYVRSPKPVHSMAYLATLIGIIQIICLVITAKLWMVLCFLGKSKSLDNEQLSKVKIHDKNLNSNAKMMGNRSVYQPKYSTAENITNENQYVPMRAMTKPTHQTQDKQYCQQCAFLAFEHLRQTSMSALEAQYLEENTRPHRSTSRRALNHSGQEFFHRSTTSDRCLGIQQNLIPTSHAGIRKSASSHTPISWRSPSWQVMHPTQRECRSTGLPRRKMSPNSSWRLRPPRNYTQRLSTIRASGVAAESDHLTNTSSDHEVGGSRCYNTEVGSSASDSENTRTRKTSKPYSSSYTYDLESETANCEPGSTRKSPQNYKQTNFQIASSTDTRKAYYLTL